MFRNGHSFFMVLFLCCSLSLSFFLGGFLTYHERFPHALIYQLHVGAIAWYENTIGESDKNNSPATKAEQSGRPDSNLWQLVKDNSDKSFDGYTILCPYGFAKAQLVDMHGSVIQEWILSDQYEDRRTFDAVHVFPTGELLAIDRRMGAESKHGLIKLRMNSNLIWSFPGWIHHDLQLDHAGNIYTLLTLIDEETPKGADYVNVPYMHEYVLVLSPNGEERHRVSIPRAFINSPYVSYFESLDFKHPKGDLTHANTVHVVGPNAARLHPQFKPKHVLLSLRNMDTIAVIDLDHEKVVWATRGPWRRQHDPEFLPNGNISLFDNLGSARRKRSRILEFDINTNSIVKRYGPKNGVDFFTRGKGLHQHLPNGNLLVSSSWESRVFELRDNEIVWEIKNPSIAREGCAHRIPKDYLQVAP